MVVELSVVQVEDVKNPHSGLPTASTTNSTFNYVRDIATPYLAIQLKEGGCIVDVKSVPNPVEVKAACYEFCRL
jgi:hypothetical protein